MIVDLIVDAVARLDEFKAPYRLEIHVVNCDRLGIPDNIKKTQGDSIMLSIQGDRNPSVKFDFEDRTLSWHAMFNRAPWLVRVHAEDIIGITSPYEGDIITFAKLRASKDYSNLGVPARGIVAKTNTVPRPAQHKPKLSVIKNEDYDENKRGTFAKPDLRVVKGNKDENKTE